MNKSFGPVRRNFSPWSDGTTPLIEFRSVTKNFGSFCAVDNLSLSIYPSEFFALLGPSGCGKTTLLRMLAGFEFPTSGEITLGGEPLTQIPAHQRPVNMMFQSYALFPHMSVAKNIAFGLKQEGMPTAQIKRRVDEMLTMVKLEEFAKRKPHQLSGGQRQRVALARSLAKKPKLLLLDEPLAALDKKLREDTQFELMDIQQELHLTFVIVTHDQEEAMTVADRIAVMDAGKIMQVATPPEIYEQPATRYVADFIGDINLVPVTVTSKSDAGYDLSAAELSVPIVSRDDRDLQLSSSAHFALRPEKLTVSHDPPENQKTNCAAGEVWDIGYVGDVSIVHVKLDSGFVFKSLVMNSARLVERPVSWGDRVWLSWADDAGLVLLS